LFNDWALEARLSLHGSRQYQQMDRRAHCVPCLINTSLPRRKAMAHFLCLGHRTSIGSPLRRSFTAESISCTVRSAYASRCGWLIQIEWRLRRCRSCLNPKQRIHTPRLVDSVELLTEEPMITVRHSSRNALTTQQMFICIHLSGQLIKHTIYVVMSPEQNVTRGPWLHVSSLQVHTS
jgi:hypothetical protein